MTSGSRAATAAITTTSNKSSNEQHPKKHRHDRVRRKAVGVEHFSSGSNKRALTKLRSKKEQKFRKNAALLRQYRKAMKLEGYDAGQGASRKRRRLERDVDAGAGAGAGAGADVNEDVNEDANEDKNVNSKDSLDKQENEENQNEEELSERKETKRKRKKGQNIFSKAKKEAENERLKKTNDMLAKEAAQKEKQVKMIQRKKQSKILARRTKKGQPVMKNVISNILDKLQKDSK